MVSFFFLRFVLFCFLLSLHSCRDDEEGLEVVGGSPAAAVAAPRLGIVLRSVRFFVPLDELTSGTGIYEESAAAGPDQRQIGR